MWMARKLAELFSLILGVTAATQETGITPETAGQAEIAIDIIAATVIQVVRHSRVTEAIAETHQTASGAGMMLIHPLLKVNQHSSGCMSACHLSLYVFHSFNRVYLPK